MNRVEDYRLDEMVKLFVYAIEDKRKPIDHARKEMLKRHSDEMKRRGLTGFNRGT